MKWFKHMSDASDDEMLDNIIEIFGLEGYGRWWLLLEAIAKQMDETDKCSATYSWVKWQSILRGKRKKLETFLECFGDKLEMNDSQNGNVLEIKIPKLLKLRDNYTKNLQVNIPKTSKQEVDVEEEVEVKEPKPKKVSRFTPPSLDEVKAYCIERKNTIDPEGFIAHYSANGWIRGKTKIKDWKACVVTWEKNQKKDSSMKIGESDNSGRYRSNDL